MDFSRAGSVLSLPGAFRARVQWNDGRPREFYGPRRPDEETAKRDLESMRAAARGMGRGDGYAAMAAEADRLEAGTPPKEAGSVMVFRNSSVACVRWRKWRGALCLRPLQAALRCRRP